VKDLQELKEKVGLPITKEGEKLNEVEEKYSVDAGRPNSELKALGQRRKSWTEKHNQDLNLPTARGNREPNAGDGGGTFRNGQHLNKKREKSLWLKT